MIANLLTIAGVDHVITLDLHVCLLHKGERRVKMSQYLTSFMSQASQMQGFFGKPVDNLFGEPLIARWIRMNVYGWREAVVVSKNAGGSKRVTSLADALKLNFGIVTTDRRRPKHGITLTDSTIFFDSIERDHVDSGISKEGTKDQHHQSMANEFSVDTRDYFFNPPSNDRLSERRLDSPPSGPQLSVADDENDYTDERARDVITARIVQGRIVDDDYSGSDQEVTLASTPRNSNTDKDNGNDPLDYTFDPMAASIVSMNSSLHPDHALGGTYDAAESDDDVTHASENNEQEQTITLVGDVKGKIVFIIDDMIDKSGSWIAAAETVVKKGGAKKVYCIATHGLFGGDSLDAMEACEAIDSIVITNSFPVSPEKASRSRKLQIIDVATLLSESIRRHHYGERYVR